MTALRTSDCVSDFIKEKTDNDYRDYDFHEEQDDSYIMDNF